MSEQELKVYGGVLFPKAKALKERPLDTLAIAVKAPRKLNAIYLVTQKFAEEFTDLVDDYFNVKVWEDRPGLPRPAIGEFCTDFFETVAYWNKETGEPEPLQVESAYDDDGEGEEPAATEARKGISMLGYEVALGLIGRKRDFDIFNVPLDIEIQANGIMNSRSDKEYLAWLEKLSNTPGIFDVSRACIVAMIKTSEDDLFLDDGDLRAYINRTIADTSSHEMHETIIEIACGRSSQPIPQTIPDETDDVAFTYDGVGHRHPDNDVTTVEQVTSLTYGQQLTIAALQGLCSNSGYSTRFNELAGMAMTLAADIVHEQASREIVKSNHVISTLTGGN